MSIDVFFSDAPIDVHIVNEVVDVVMADDALDVHLGFDGPMGPTGPVGPPGGQEISRVASVALGGHRAVRSLGAACAYASCDTAADAEAVIGVTLEAAAAGSFVRIASQEEIVEPSWSFAPGPVFVGFNGGLVQPAPTVEQGAVFIRQIGVATAADRLLVQIRPPIFIS